MSLLTKLYEVRFSEEEMIKKKRVWQVLCQNFFQKFISKDATVLDLACGFGEFLCLIQAKRKIGIDMNPKLKEILPAEVEFHLGSASKLDFLEANSIDVVFVGNFFEHLPTKEVMTEVLLETNRVLKPGGLLMMMQPNIKYCSKSYWDFYDHHLPLSHLSAIEGVEMTGFRVKRVVPKFVPFPRNPVSPAILY